jgi:uncharacterized protein involved in type VI secretion and phage assembly
MAGEFDTDDPRFTALYIGEVVDREDPEGIGRVRVRVPGLLEPASAWAFPLGTMGGGSDRRGFFAVPEKGAEVGVLFHQGDVDHPYYLSGHWGKPDGKAEVPEPLRDLSKEDAPKVRAFETERFLLVFDDRSGSEKLLLKDKVTEDLITIEAEAGIRIKTAKDVTVEVEGNVVVAAKGDASVDVDGNVSVTAGGSAKVDAGSEAVVAAPDVQLGASGLAPPANGVVLGGGIDTFTGLTYSALRNASAVVKAKK